MNFRCYILSLFPCAFYAIDGLGDVRFQLLVPDIFYDRLTQHAIDKLSEMNVLLFFLFPLVPSILSSWFFSLCLFAKLLYLDIMMLKTNL